MPELRRNAEWWDIDALWITPFYPSPGADHGYDVADYCDVDPAFGTLDDFDALVADAHELGLRIVIDIVPNHSSIEHPWFREHRERYVWAAGWNGGPAHWSELSVAAQRDEPGSMLSLYREALRLRPRGQTLSWRESAPGTLVFECGGIVCAVNVDAPALAVPEHVLVLASDPATRDQLPPGTAAWLRA